MADADEYDELFAVLKHPVRRRILLFIEQKGEASFTEIQEETRISDTGLMSYHLKELSPLLKQAKRGKYCLSEVGLAGVALFRKVENNRQRSSAAVHVEIENFIGLTLKKSMFFLCIAGLTLIAPLTFDIMLSVKDLSGHNLSGFELSGIFLLTLIIMLTGVLLFSVYDKHYYSKILKVNIIHTVAYAGGIAAINGLSYYSVYNFTNSTLETPFNLGENLSSTFGVLRIILFLVCAPLIVYLGNIVRFHRQEKND